MGSFKTHILLQILLLSFIGLSLSQDLVIKNLDTLAPSGVITAEFNGQSYQVTYNVEALNGGNDPIISPPPPPGDVNKANYTLCDPNNRPEACTEEFRGVCAFIEGCLGGECVRTTGTGCQACADPTVYAWMEGTCDDIQSACDPNVNPAAISCLADFDPACGIKLDCRGDDCVQTASNACNACAASANFSLPTQCPPKPAKANNVNYTLCDPNNRPEACTLEFRGVCAFIEGCQGGQCVKTTGTGCQACGDPTVYAWMEGTCEDIQSTCDPNVNPAAISCLADPQPACGIKANCTGDECIQDAVNACNACATSANFSLPTECPPKPAKVNKPSYTLCDPNNRPEFCTKEFRGVCAFVEGCKGGQCVKTTGTECQACADPTVYAWMEGTCEDIQSTCDPNINAAAISCPAEPALACGIKTNCTGDDCIQTAVNDCNACAASANFSLPTECPPMPVKEVNNTNYTLCDPNNRPEVCTEEFRGVCAFIEGCQGGECVKTTGTECQACADPTVYAWMEGTCEGIQTPCDPNIDPALVDCINIFQPACGIKLDCSGDDCIQTAPNACNTCAARANFSLPTQCPPQPVGATDDNQLI